MDYSEGVSIVVTAYNVEKYLNRCLESLQRQTYANIEIILVDDGSTDETPLICDKWLNKDTRVRVVHKENGGLSDARNTGIKLASREYICFVDGDDYIEDNLIELSYKKALQSNADSVIFSNYDVSINGEKSKHNFTSLKDIYYKNEIMGILFSECLGTMPNEKSDYSVGFAPWGRLCKTKILIDNSIYFKSERILIYEDLMFLLDLMPVLNKVAILNTPLYDYCENENSLTRKYDPTRFKKIKKQYFYLKQNEPYKSEIFNDSDILLRFKRTMLGYIRNSVTRSLDSSPYVNIKKITSDSFTHEILDDYPINKLPLKQRVFAYFIKYKLNLLTLLVARLNKLTKK